MIFIAQTKIDIFKIEDVTWYKKFTYCQMGILW